MDSKVRMLLLSNKPYTMGNTNRPIHSFRKHSTALLLTHNNSITTFLDNTLELNHPLLPPSQVLLVNT